MMTIKRVVGLTRTLTVTAAFILALSASATLACPQVTIDPMTGEAMNVNELRAALKALNQEPVVAETTR